MLTSLAEYLPHSICLAVDPLLIWLHGISDFLAAASYFSLPVVMIVFAVKRNDLRYRWLFWLSASFVLACGATHALGVVTLWWPVYYAQGIAKAATAAISVLTAILVWPLLPKALAIPSQRELEYEIEERRRAEEHIKELNISLADQVRERTRQLEKARDEALAATVEAQRANVAKSKFLAAASHDLRQPAQAVALMYEVLRTRVQGSELETLVEQMAQPLEAQRLLLDGLLHIGKLDAGIVKPAIQEVRLDEVLSRLSAEYQVRASVKGLRVHSARTSCRIETDPLILERMLRNLIENALKYTDRGGFLVGCRRRGATVRIDVVDTGPGIPEDERKAIFEEFYQLHNPSRDRSLGLGLGLAIVRRKIELLRGRVELASTMGKGSRFSLVLPVCWPSS